MGLLRIVGGSLRGRRIRVPAGGAVRPTADLVREAVFNVLGDVEGAHVLDVFAGTGALGLEALSRGAAWCTFIEHDRRVSSVLRENIACLGMRQVCEVIAANYTAGLSVVERRGRLYDVVFVDPPYRMTSVALAHMEGRWDRLVKVGGVVVVEASKTETAGLSLDEVFTRVYGDTSIRIFRRGEGDQ